MRGTRGSISRASLLSVPFSNAPPHSGSFLKPTRFSITVVVFFTIFRTTKPFLTPSAHTSSRMLSRASLLACVSSADMCSSFNKFSGRGLPRAVVEIFEVPSLPHCAPPFPLCSIFATHPFPSTLFLFLGGALDFPHVCVGPQGEDTVNIAVPLKAKKRNLNRPGSEPLSKVIFRLRTTVAPPTKGRGGAGKGFDTAAEKDDMGAGARRSRRIGTDAGSAMPAKGENNLEAAELLCELICPVTGAKVDESTANRHAWQEGHILRVGEEEFIVSLNPPSVLCLLQEGRLSATLRPHPSSSASLHPTSVNGSGTEAATLKRRNTTAFVQRDKERDREKASERARELVGQR